MRLSSWRLENNQYAVFDQLQVDDGVAVFVYEGHHQEYITELEDDGDVDVYLCITGDRLPRREPRALIAKRVLCGLYFTYVGDFHPSEGYL